MKHVTITSRVAGKTIAEQTWNFECESFVIDETASVFEFAGVNLRNDMEKHHRRTFYFPAPGDSVSVDYQTDEDMRADS